MRCLRGLRGGSRWVGWMEVARNGGVVGRRGGVYDIEDAGVGDGGFGGLRDG